jgi:glycine betaine/proline transport system substrate-binding protein
MKLLPTSLRSLIAMFAAVGLLGIGLAGCGGGGDDEEVSREMNMVTVNWIEGMALTYVQEQILENRYDMEVDVREVGGGGIAFSSVADGDRDYFNEAWLPTTHQEPWSKAQGNAKKLGYTFKGTTAGLAVPTYMDMEEISELPDYRDELDGQINGIESGAAVNDQARQILENNDIEGFSVVTSSGPATWQALESAIENEEPIVVTGWEPHWKWDEYDLKYIQNARTGQTPVFGGKEDAFTIVDSEFINEFPREAVCFLQEFEASQTQVGTLMKAFQDRGDMSKEEAAAQWIENHSDEVEEWTSQAEECANSGEELEYLPDDATFSRSQGDMEGST